MYQSSEITTQQLKREIRRMEKMLKRGRMNQHEREVMEEDLAILRQDLEYCLEYV
jgi:hypothetical protein